MQTAYERLGGHDRVVALVDRFYDHMDTRADAAALRALHDDDLTSDRHKLTAFLSGWLGGPALYWEGHSEDLVRRRHAHLPVDTAAAQAWLRCMNAAMEDVIEDPAFRKELARRFARFAMHARNVG